MDLLLACFSGASLVTVVFCRRQSRVTALLLASVPSGGALLQSQLLLQPARPQGRQPLVGEEAQLALLLRELIQQQVGPQHLEPKTRRGENARTDV